VGTRFALVIGLAAQQNCETLGGRPDVLAPARLEVTSEALLTWLVLGLIGVVILRRLLRPKIDPGERRVRATIRRGLNRREYRALHDLTLPTLDGTTQIDHVIVSQCGVFVIETKDLTGWIFGNERSRRWTQVIFRRKHRFQNPLHQNYKHLKAVENLLDLAPQCLHSVVVFVGNSEFKTLMPSNVLERRWLVPYIRSMKDVLLTDEQVEKSIRILESHVSNAETRRRHIENLERNERNPVCPRCGSAMALRTAKRGPNAGGEFWGCSAYPRCRATKSSA
jgi:restriction system protein